MLQRLTQYWWLMVLRGIISIAFGIIAFMNPKVAFEVLVMILGAFLIADGIIAVILGIRMRAHDQNWWVVLSEGLLGVGLGLFALLSPEITATGIVLILALWFLISGIFEISTAIKLRKEIDNEWLLGGAGALSVILGLIMLINPSTGAFSLGMWISIYALLFGIMLVGLGLRLKRAGSQG